MSFVNQDAAGTGVWVWEGADLEPFAVETKSAVGMALNEGLLYVAAAGENLFTVDVATGDVLGEEPMLTSAVHSLAVVDGRLLAVSTGNGRVVSRALDGGPWEPAGAHGTGGDTYHLNSVTGWGGDVVVSAFGPKDGGRWGTDGYILNLATGERLTAAAQPHSLLAWRDDLWFCESARGTVRSLAGRTLEVGGYTRGLAPLDETTLLVGVSDSRNGGTSGAASLWAADIDAGETTLVADVAHVGPEIYAVVTDAGGA